MSIKESLHYDRASDSIIGREDFGEHEKSLKLSNHVRVLYFMVKGLTKKWKIVLGYFLNLGGMRTCQINEVYEVSIKKVEEMGMRVIFTL